jgi:hypothetical protein
MRIAVMVGIRKKWPGIDEEVISPLNDTAAVVKLQPPSGASGGHVPIRDQ